MGDYPRIAYAPSRGQTIVNMTGREIIVRSRTRQGETVETVFRPSSKILKIILKSSRPIYFSDIPIKCPEPEDIEELPKTVERNVRYLVNGMVFRTIEDRKDFVTPGAPIREVEPGHFWNLNGHRPEEVETFLNENVGFQG